MDAVVACVGGFGNQEQMERICGDTNIEVAKAAREEGVRRYVFISAAVYPGVDKVLTGYYRGKARVEQELKENWSSDGDSDSKEENKVGWSALRPGFIYGTRLVNGVPVPLGLIGKPMSFFLSLPVINQLQKLPVLGNLFLPPVDVEDVALTAVLAAEGKPGTDGILYTEDIVTLPKTLAGDE